MPALPLPLHALLLAAYVVLLGLFGLQYRRGDLTGRRLYALVGMSLCWIAYSLTQLDDELALPNGGPLELATLALTLAVLLGGVASMAYAWVHDFGERTT